MGTNFYWLADLPPTKVLTRKTPTGEVFTIETKYALREVQSENTTGLYYSAEGLEYFLHIGRRSSAGPYCWDCHQTLCRDGEAKIHFSNSGWYKRCPVCGKKEKLQGLAESVRIELGFQPPRKTKPKSVRSSSSFSWAQDPEVVRKACRENADKPILEDEYHTPYTGQEFLDMLEANCPIEYTHSIGVAFS